MVLNMISKTVILSHTTVLFDNGCIAIFSVLFTLGKDKLVLPCILPMSQLLNLIIIIILKRKNIFWHPMTPIPLWTFHVTIVCTDCNETNCRSSFAILYHIVSKTSQQYTHSVILFTLYREDIENTKIFGDRLPSRNIYWVGIEHYQNF